MEDTNGHVLQDVQDIQELTSSQTPIILPDERERVRPREGDVRPMARFVSIICVDRHVSEEELMNWDMELQMMCQASEEAPNRILFGSTSDRPWEHGLKPQLLPVTDYTIPLEYTNLNELGRFAWVDIPLPKKFCGFDGHLVLRHKRDKSCTQKANSDGVSENKQSVVYPPRLIITNYMTYVNQGHLKTPDTRALVIDTAKNGEGNSLGVYTIHICDLFFNGEEILFPESYQQALYRPLVLAEPNGNELLTRSPEEIIMNEMNSYSVSTARMILDPIVGFQHVIPAGYIENANTAGRPIHAETLDILMTQRARNKIIELRNRFKHVSSRQRYLHFSPRDIFPLLLCQRDEVAALLKVSTTWLKDRIRAFGVTEWPARALMVHSSELRMDLIYLRHLIGDPKDGVRARVAAGLHVGRDIVATVKGLYAKICKLRHERFAILKAYLTPSFYQEFTQNAAIWCLDPNWDSQPPWEYAHKDHNLSYGFGRLSVVRNYPPKDQVPPPPPPPCNTQVPSRDNELKTEVTQTMCEQLSYI